jgi:CspA family cold shock protein
MSDTKKKLGLKPKTTRGVDSDEPTQETYEHDQHQNNDDQEHVDKKNNHVDEHHEDDEEPTGVSLEGRVKWFNDRRGYGYITCISEGPHNGQDIFIHHSNIRPKVSNYKTLYPNEYVEFRLGEADMCFDEDENPVETEYEHQATHVTGIKCGPLLCDGSFRPNRRPRDFRGGSNRAHKGSSSRNDDEEEDSNPRGHQNGGHQNGGHQNGGHNSSAYNGRNSTGYNGNNRRPNRRDDREENWQSVDNKGRAPQRRN